MENFHFLIHPFLLIENSIIFFCNLSLFKLNVAGIVLVDEGLAPSLVAAVLNHLQSVKMKKLCEEENSEVTGSVHLQPLVTHSSYHQDKDIQKRQNTAAKLRPKADGRIQQATPEVRLEQ